MDGQGDRTTAAHPAASGDDLLQVDDLNSVLDDKNFVVVDPGVDQARMLTEIEELKQQLAVVDNVIAKSNLAENQVSRLTAQSHISVTQLVDENSLLESQVKVLRDKLSATQLGNMSELKAMFEAEKQELISKYTFEVEDLQMNCKLQAQHAQENSSRYHAEASNVEKLNATIRKLQQENAAQAATIQALETKNKHSELKIATDAEDVALGRSLANGFEDKIDELHGRIEAMFAAASEDDAGADSSQSKMLAKELSEAQVKLQKVELDKERAAKDRAQAAATEATLNELCEAEKSAKEEYKSKLEKVTADLEAEKAARKAELAEERTKHAQATDSWRGKIHDIKSRRDKLDLLYNETSEKLGRTEAALVAARAAHASQGELWSKREVVLRAAVTRLQKFVKSLQGQVERYREKVEAHSSTLGFARQSTTAAGGGAADGSDEAGPVSAATAAVVSDLQAEILHLKISNRKSEEQLRLLRKELASAKTANVLALASARRLSEQAENALAMAAALEIEEARRSGSTDVMNRVNRSMAQLFQHQHTAVAQPTRQDGGGQAGLTGGNLEGLVPGQRVRIVALIDDATDRPSVHNNSLATIKTQLTSRRDPRDNRFVVVVDGLKGEHVQVAARNLVWGKELGEMGSLPSRSSVRRAGAYGGDSPKRGGDAEEPAAPILSAAQKQMLVAVRDFTDESTSAGTNSVSSAAGPTPQKPKPTTTSTTPGPSPAKANYSDVKAKIVAKFGDFKFNRHKALIQLELKRLSEGKPSLLDDPSGLPDLGANNDDDSSNADSSPSKFGWWNQLTSNVKRAFNKNGKTGGKDDARFTDFDIVLRPDSVWGFSLQKVDPEQVNSLAAVRLDDADFDEDIEIEGAGTSSASTTIAEAMKLEDGDVVIRVDGQECTGWPDTAIKAGMRRVKNNEVDAPGVTLTLRRHNHRVSSGANAGHSASATASTENSATSSRRTTGTGDTPQKRNEDALAMAAAAAEAAASSGAGTQWKLVPIDSSSPPLDSKGKVCRQDDPKVKAVYEAWTDNPARHAALRGWFGRILSGGAFSETETSAKVELKGLSSAAITGFLNVVLPLLLHDAPMLDLEVYLRRSPDTKKEEEDPLLGGPVLMDMRLFVSPKFL